MQALITARSTLMPAVWMAMAFWLAEAVEEEPK